MKFPLAAREEMLALYTLLHSITPAHFRYQPISNLRILKENDSLIEVATDASGNQGWAAISTSLNIQGPWS